MTFAHVLWLLAVLLALVGVWPFGPYQLTLLAARAFFGPRPIRTSSEAGAQESFALCVCAHNEENVIERKIRNLLDIREAANEDVEILIYCDGCTDGTEAIARRFEPVVKVIASQERHGKYYRMNMLAEAARESSLSFGPLPVLLMIGGMAASFAAALALRIRLAERIGSAIVAIAGTSVGFLRGLRGEQVAMWEGPRSSRQGLVLPP